MKEIEIHQTLKTADWNSEGKRFRAWIGLKWKEENE